MGEWEEELKWEEWETTDEKYRMKKEREDLEERSEQLKKFLDDLKTSNIFATEQVNYREADERSEGWKE